MQSGMQAVRQAGRQPGRQIGRQAGVVGLLLNNFSQLEAITCLLLVFMLLG